MNPQIVSRTLRRHESEPGAGGSEGLRGKASDLKRQASDALRTTTGQIKSTASEAAQEVKEQAAGMAEDQKERAAERVGGYSSAMHSAAERLEGEDPNIAWVTHNLADRVQRAADYLRHSDLSTLQRDVEDLARRNPLVFFGGLFVAGLVVGNLVKASGRSSREFDEDPNAGSHTRGYGDRESFGESAFSGYRTSGESIASAAPTSSTPAAPASDLPGSAGTANPTPSM